jgi:hypothetical protein
MTKEELCDALRNTHPSRMMCKKAADEIERLDNELRLAPGPDSILHELGPRPDASAGLIEAAEINYILTTLKHARVFITSLGKDASNWRGTLRRAN